MKMLRCIMAFTFMVATATGLMAQSTNCQANFSYVYTPWLVQPEEDVYQFSDSSTGKDSTTTYLWSFGTGDFSSNPAPSYTYDLDDSTNEQVCLTIHNTSNGCTSTYCDSIKLDDLCVGAHYTYTQQGNTFTFTMLICGTADSIYWDFGDGTTATNMDTVTHTYQHITTETDSYYVCMKAFLNPMCQYNVPCKAINCEEMYIYPTGIANAGLQNEAFKIYPDPASEYISIKAAETTLPAQLVITDVAGDVLITTKTDNAAPHIGISNLAAGIYFLQAKSEDGKENVVRRFVKQ